MFCQTKPKNFCFEFLCSCKTTVLELSTSLFSDPCHCLHIQFQYLPEAEAVAVSVFLHRLNICSHCCVWSKELRTGRSHARATRRLSAGLQLTPNRDPALTGSSHKLLGLPQNFVKPYLQIKYSLCPATVIKIKRNLANNPQCCTESLCTWKVQKPEMLKLEVQRVPSPLMGFCQLLMWF